MTTSKPRAQIEGRLYQGVLAPDSKHSHYTIAELRALSLAGEPLFLEHDEAVGPVGTITSNRVDEDGWLWITASLYEAEDLGGDTALPDRMREMLRSGLLRDLSIGYHAPYTDETKTRCGAKRFDEASLVARGKYKGTSIMRIQASQLRINSDAPSEDVQSANKAVSTQATKQQQQRPMDSNDIIEVKAIASKIGARELTEADFAGKTRSQLIEQLAIESASKANAERTKLTAELDQTRQIAQEFNERLRTEQQPKADRFMQVMKSLDVKDEDTVRGIASAYSDRETLRTASVLDSLVTGLEAERAKNIELMKRVEDSMKRADESEARAKEALLADVSGGGKRRAPDGRFASSCAQELAAGGAGAGNNDAMMTERASGHEDANKMSRSSAPGASADAEARASMGRRLFPAAFVGNGNWYERASASASNETSSRLDAPTVNILKRLIDKSTQH